MVGPGYGGPLPFPLEPRPTENDGPGEVAAAGVTGPAETLPHGDAIQRSFGSQDVSDVRAHVGGHAADAADALGADAFATGNDVAFRESPDLHTAAHEAAHAVQQRGGVQLSDGVGQEGDAYERHADAVADRVVAGRSAADLLPADGQGSAAPATATQRKPVQKRPKKGEATTGGAPESAIDESEAIGTMQVAADVVQNRQRRLIDSAPQRARAALELLHQATVGTLQRERGSAPLEPSQRLDHLDRALRGLEEAMRAVHASDPGWFRAEFAEHVERLRGDIQVDVARERVDRAVLLPGEKAAVEVPKEGLSDETAAAYSQVVLPSIDKLIATYTMLNEQIIRVGHERFHHLFAEMQKGWDSGMLRMERSRFKDAGSIVTAQSALFLIKGLLSAPHAWEHASHAEGVVGKLESYTHLVQVAIETVGGLATLSAAIGACVVKLAGDLRLATQMMGFASLGTLTLANVVAAVELVHGILLVANPKASADQKLQGAVQIGLGLAWFGGTLLKAPKVGGAISALLAVGYLEWQLSMAAHAHVSSTLVVAGLRPRFEYMADHAVSIRTSADTLIKAGLLLERESDPAKQEALSRVVQESTSHLSATVDGFLDACVRGKQVSPTEPGENPHLREAFAPLLSLRGPVQDPQAALHKANLVLTRIGEVLHDAANYVRLSMGLDRVDNAPAAEHD